MVANFDSSMSSIRNTVETGTVGNRALQGIGSTQMSFRESLEVLVKEQQPNGKTHTMGSQSLTDEVGEGESTESIQYILADLETFTKESIDLSDYEDVFLTIPPDLIEQIKAFITDIQNGDKKLEADKGYGKAELIGLLIVTAQYVEEPSNTNKEGLIALLKQLKMTFNESLPASSNGLGDKEPTDIKFNKIVKDMMQTLENKLSDKPLTESQNKHQYLQVVHARYFSTPKGIETPQTVITDKLMQKTSNMTKVMTSTSEGTPLSDVGSNQLSKVQQFSLFVEQNGKQMPNQQQFIKQFQNILARSNFFNSGGQQKLLINLYPEHLGSLRIELLQSESGMIARIMASTTQAKELVESQLTNLKHTFLAQNISVEKIEVSTQLQYQTERSLQRESEQQQGQQSGRQPKENDQQETNEDHSFTSVLLDELVNFKV
ncbi:flagellar hook-length control protein FliK [Fredinandcohnia sp. QZ13]|uniref:flagellar hook-length control protein FliK n=1 Tax=Fredinandcohnia sp. QZ13 TaxID=3073144 RepID=UPI002853521E|nr:flagellar hook-length control protein FliK [Fredinandcohnia sp. QZ13]MDR4886496.1 flagellar hook-length control protein FliK [Fredinandcohnia sp. QZ13]